MSTAVQNASAYQSGVLQAHLLLQASFVSFTVQGISNIYTVSILIKVHLHTLSRCHVQFCPRIPYNMYLTKPKNHSGTTIITPLTLPLVHVNYCLPSKLNALNILAPPSLEANIALIMFMSYSI